MIGVDTLSVLKHGFLDFTLVYAWCQAFYFLFKPHIWLHGSHTQTIYEDKFKYFIR